MEASLTISPFYGMSRVSRADVVCASWFLLKKIQEILIPSKEDKVICDNLLEFCPIATRSSLEDIHEDEQLRDVLDKIREIVGTEKYTQTVFPILFDLFYLWIWFREEHKD
jgi:hypothetical protein